MNSSKKAGAVLALALLAGWGCSDFLNGPGLTENPNNPLVATPIQILVSIQANVATRLEGQLARCASVFTQQLIGSNNQQLQWCTAYLVGESDISGQMSGFYTGGGLYGVRQVEAAAFLRQVGRREVDRDAARGEIETRSAQGGAYAVAGFLHLGIGHFHPRWGVEGSSEDLLGLGFLKAFQVPGQAAVEGVELPR